MKDTAAKETTEKPLLHRIAAQGIAMRRAIRNFFIALFALSAAIFFLSGGLLQAVQQHLGGTLYFFSVAGPFLAHVKLAFFGALFLLMPWGATLLWQAAGRIFSVQKRTLRIFGAASCLLFYGGTLFCYMVTLPFGIQFLLGFGSEELRPVISVGRCINFVTIFLLGFGVVFELPVIMVFFTQVKLLSVGFYRKNRRYAILAIAILSALLTPTPDVVNMALMGAPLYFLYEAGIIAAVFFSEEKGNKS